MLVVGGMLLNILLNLVLVRAYGALGAAVDTAIAFTGLTAATLAVVRWRTGLWPLSRGLLKPFAISAAAATLGCLMRTMGSGLVWGIVVCFLAVGLYAVGTWFLGLDPRDRERARLAVARLTR